MILPNAQERILFLFYLFIYLFIQFKVNLLPQKPFGLLTGSKNSEGCCRRSMQGGGTNSPAVSCQRRLIVTMKRIGFSLKKKKKITHTFTLHGVFFMSPVVIRHIKKQF